MNSDSDAEMDNGTPNKTIAFVNVLHHSEIVKTYLIQQDIKYAVFLLCITKKKRTLSGMESNFEKLYPVELNDLGLDYDYRSIMHYKAWSYAKDGSSPTLRPKDDSVPLKALGYGQTEGSFTELDVQKINKFYACP
ncbi:metalloendopeptidase [Trichonephila clavipes]|nr:metalloendopeptidase [Trichonephila clavipes]